MISFWKTLFLAVPLGFGIVLSLISIAFTCLIMGDSDLWEVIIGAMFFGGIGYPLLIASAIKLTKKISET